MAWARVSGGTTSLRPAGRRPRNTGARHEQTTAPREPPPEQDAAIRAAGGWVHQLARPLKPCRLYDSGTPTALRSRKELAGSLERILGEHEPWLCASPPTTCS